MTDLYIVLTCSCNKLHMKEDKMRPSDSLKKKELGKTLKTKKIPATYFSPLANNHGD